MDIRRTIDTTARYLTNAGALNVKSSFINKPAVCVSCIGSVGKTVLVDQPFVSNQQINSIVVYEYVERLFVYYNLLGRKDEIRLKASGSVQPIMNKSDFGRLTLRIPDQPTQKRIAKILGSLDDKIELNRRMNETLEEMARALFRDWFIDFGPTRRQMDGATDPAAIMGHAFPDTKAATLAPLFPARLGEDGLPEGWEPGTASDHIDFNPREPLRKGTFAPYTDMASLPTSGSLITPPTERDFKAGMRFRNGDALIARITPCLENGKAGFVDFLTEESPVGWGSTEFFVLRAKPHVAPQFSYCLARDPDFKKRAEQSMTGTSGRQRAQVKVLMSYEIPTPTDGVHTAFGEFTALLFAKIKANGQENQTLTALRDLLLPKLMSGEIHLKENEVAA